MQEHRRTVVSTATNIGDCTDIEDSAMDLFGNFKTWISRGVLGFGKHEGKETEVYLTSKMSCGRIGSNRHIQCGNTSRAIFSRHLTISNRLETNGKAKLATMTSSIHLPIINPHSQKKPQLVMGALLCFCYPCLYSEVAVAEMLVQRAAQVNLK
ncbi:hypothetical protein Peur_036749 [Populus x canadensis]